MVLVQRLCAHADYVCVYSTWGVLTGTLERVVHWCTACGALGLSDPLTEHLTLCWRAPHAGA